MLYCSGLLPSHSSLPSIQLARWVNIYGAPSVCQALCTVLECKDSEPNIYCGHRFLIQPVWYSGWVWQERHSQRWQPHADWGAGERRLEEGEKVTWVIEGRTGTPGRGRSHMSHERMAPPNTMCMPFLFSEWIPPSYPGPSDVCVGIGSESSLIWLYPQSLAQCLPYRRCSIRACWTDLKWMLWLTIYKPTSNTPHWTFTSMWDGTLKVFVSFPSPILLPVFQLFLPHFHSYWSPV